MFIINIKNEFVPGAKLNDQRFTKLFNRIIKFCKLLKR